jgi:hypothetical protein
MHRIVLFFVLATLALSQQNVPHPIPGGCTLPNGWRITPLGSAVDTEDLVLNTGHGNSPRNNVATPFRTETFNLLNKTDVATVSGANSNSSAFGVFNATFRARQIQLTLKPVS